MHSEEVDSDSAYILFYEQQGVNYSQFLPKIDGKKMADTSSMDEDFESDYKKYCVLQWWPSGLPSARTAPALCCLLLLRAGDSSTDLPVWSTEWRQTVILWVKRCAAALSTLDREHGFVQMFAKMRT